MRLIVARVRYSYMEKYLDDTWVLSSSRYLELYSCKKVHTYLYFPAKNRVVARIRPKKRADKVILDPIQNRAPARLALFEAALIEALLYIVNVHSTAVPHK